MIFAQNLAMGAVGEWKPAFKVVAPLVIAKDQAGRLHHAYRGSLLGWLSPQQTEHFLRMGLVERVGEDAEVMPAPEDVGNAIAALARLGVPLDAGRPTAAKALRDNGHKLGNAVIAEAVRIRQGQAALKAEESFPEIHA